MPEYVTPPFEPFTPEQLLGPLNDVESKNAPPILFAAGDRSLLADTVRVAIVGTRQPSAEGKNLARSIAMALARQEVVVVSGLASGIDTAAHTGALDANGRTVAVLGTPIDRVYPSKNAELQQRIASRDLLVSQFPAGEPIQRSNFPRRNRVMALISDASVIIEAGEKSGTISQAAEALRLGRPLFLSELVVSRGLEWSRKMLDSGAMPLSSVTDLLEFLPADGRPAVAF